jgi:hypothetical protein
MEMNLHANAATTPKTRGYIQRSTRPVRVLAAELGVSETTIRRWRERTTTADRSHTPKRLMISLSAMEQRSSVNCAHGPRYYREGPGYYRPGRFRTWNGCQSGWTVQDGLCKPYRGR